MNSTVHVYPAPADVEPSADYQIQVDGQPVFVHSCQVGSFAAFDFEGDIEVSIRCREHSGSALVRPHSCKIEAHFEGEALKFRLNEPGNFYVEFGSGMPPLMLFANSVEKERPAADDPKVLWFKAGEVYDVGRLEIPSGHTLYIEGGAVLKGAVYAAQGENVRICGRGLIDGSHFAYQELRLLVFEGCQNVQVEGIMTVGTPSWNLVFGACDKVHVDNVKLIGWVVCSDGIDIVGSRDVVVQNCFLRNNDDCVAVKAVSYDMRSKYSIGLDWRRDVENVLVEKCVMYNDRAGNVMEIGFETQTNSMRNITFRDIDVLAGHGEGGVFTIHNGDRATVSDVLYENIRVEHFYSKLVDFRIMHSRYSKDAERGQIRNVTLRNVQTIADKYNVISLIGGFDAEHTVENIHFENFVMGETKVLSPDDLNLFSRNAQNVTFQ
jgi:polygalacturonase